MKHGKRQVDAEAEHLMKSHAMFCLKRAAAFLNLVDANKFQALQEELARMKKAMDAISAVDEKIVLTEATLRWIGLLAINASAAAGALQAAIANIATNTKNMLAATEKKSEAAP